MGYSITVPAQSKALQVKMAKLFEAEYKTYDQVWRLHDTNFQRSSAPRLDVSYKPRKTKHLIGIDYKSGLYGPERLYAYTLMHWIAIKIGVTKTLGELYEATQDEHLKDLRDRGPLPFVFYDVGDQVIPILVRKPGGVPQCLHEGCVDIYGIAHKPTMDFTDFAVPTERLRDEMRRLDALWESR